MTAQEVRTIIRKELADGALDMDLHGLTAIAIQTEPYEEAYLSFDLSEVFRYWTVVEEMPDTSGHTIHYDPGQYSFGPGTRTDEGVVDIGTYATFRAAFRGMWI